MRFRWFGHACFELIFDSGTTIVTDPFDASLGYPMPDLKAQGVTSSHNHSDHNFIEAVKGDPQVVSELGQHRIGEVDIVGVKTYHDANQGESRGENIVFVFDDGTIRVAHLGDLGHLLDQDQIDAIGPLDVLIVPVGGFYTIGPEEAAAIVEQLQPKAVIPMHFKTDVIDLPIASVDDFLSAMGTCGWKVPQEWVEVDPAELDDDRRIYVLKYAP